MNYRKIASPFVYLFTFVLIYSAFFENADWEFKKLNTYSFDFYDYLYPFQTWGSHYLIFGFSIILSTFFSAFISGAFYKDDQKINLGLIYSLPFVGILLMYFIHLNSDLKIYASHLQFQITTASLLILVPITSFYGFKWGCEEESRLNIYISNESYEIKTSYDEDRILNIHKYNWLWILLPILSPSYIWLTALFYSGLKLLEIWNQDHNFLNYIKCIMYFIPFSLWIATPVIIYKILSTELFGGKSKTYRFTIILMLIIFGFIIAMLSQILFYYIADLF